MYFGLTTELFGILYDVHIDLNVIEGYCVFVEIWDQGKGVERTREAKLLFLLFKLC